MSANSLYPPYKIKVCMKSLTCDSPLKWWVPDPGPGAGAGAMDGPGARASKIGKAGGDPAGDGDAGFFKRFVLGSTSGAPVGSTAEIEARLRLLLKLACTDFGIQIRSMPCITPSGRTTSLGRVTVVGSMMLLSPDSDLWLE